MGLPSTVPSKFLRAGEEIEQLKQLVSFRIGSEEFGVDILMVQEIIRLTAITPIPNASRAILGMINLRGRIIPIVDLRWYLNLEAGQDAENDRKRRILIIEMGGYVTGFIVDSVSEVMKVRQNEIEPAPNLVTSNVSSTYISGVIKLPGRLVIVLDFKQILRPGEKRELEQIGTNPALIEASPACREIDIRLNIPKNS